MLPSIFGENLFDDFFGDPFGMMPRGRDPLYGKHARNLMRTDVRETEDTYELDVDLPGFKKDEVTLELKNGVLTIQAVKGLDKDETDKKGKYIRQERYAGACSRSFYVGDAVEPEDVSAKFEDGILTISVPKNVKKQLPKIFDIELQDCPICRGVGAMQDEQGWSVSVACMDCGAETAHAEYRTPEERLESARRVALLWNMGKVVHTGASD